VGIKKLTWLSYALIIGGLPRLGSPKFVLSNSKKMKKFYLWITVAIIVASVNIAKNFSGIRSHHAIYVYELLKNTNWPVEKKNGAFIIGVFGKTAIFNELRVLAENHHVGARSIEVVELTSIEDVKNCNLAYMPGVGEEDMERINSISKREGVLIVTEGPEMSSKGGAVNFISNKGKLEYEVDQAAANDARLSFNDKILNKGAKVYKSEQLN
jgi:hypothetical protein